MMSALARRGIQFFIILLPFVCSTLLVSVTAALGYIHDAHPQEYEEQVARLLGVQGEVSGTARTWKVETPWGSFREVESYLQPFYIEYWTGSQALFYVPADVWNASIRASQKYEWCDPRVLIATAHSESPTYRNHSTPNEAGALGVWQFIPSTWDMMWPDEKNRPEPTDIDAAADAACRYLNKVGLFGVKSELEFVLKFAVVPPVWNQHQPQARYVWRLIQKLGPAYMPTVAAGSYSFSGLWSEGVAHYLDAVGLWPEGFSIEPGMADGEGSASIGGDLCRPVPDKASISFHYGVSYKFGTHYGTDFIIKKDGNYQQVPAFALTEGTISTGWHYTVDGIVVLKPTGFKNVEIKYFHMMESTIDDLPKEVKCGDPLGIADGGGTVSDGSHLHLEIWENGVKVDPVKWIEDNGGQAP